MASVCEAIKQASHKRGATTDVEEVGKAVRPRWTGPCLGMKSKAAAPSGELASHSGCLHMPLDIKVGESQVLALRGERDRGRSQARGSDQ